MTGVSAFSTKHLKAAQKYLDDCPHTVPTIAGLSRTIKVARSTIYKWIADDVNESFSDIAGELLAEQEIRLVNQGLDGTYNASIAKLLLHKHNYHDKVDTAVDSTTTITHIFEGIPFGKLRDSAE